MELCRPDSWHIFGNDSFINVYIPQKTCYNKDVKKENDNHEERQGIRDFGAGKMLGDIMQDRCADR